MTQPERGPGDDDRVRSFLAVFPTSEVQATAAAAVEPLRAIPGVSWVKPANLHFTLRFLGNLDDDGVRRAGEAGAAAAGAHRVFPAVLGPAGGFPHGRAARVLWLGLAAGAAELVALAAALEQALAARSLGVAVPSFQPHLTVGRVREPGRDWTADLAGLRVPPVGWTVNRLLLMRSRLSPRGATYEPLGSFALRA